jgi:hypothetical protein
VTDVSGEKEVDSREEGGSHSKAEERQAFDRSQEGCRNEEEKDDGEEDCGEEDRTPQVHREEVDGPQVDETEDRGSQARGPEVHGEEADVRPQASGEEDDAAQDDQEEVRGEEDVRRFPLSIGGGVPGRPPSAFHLRARARLPAARQRTSWLPR